MKDKNLDKLTLIVIIVFAIGSFLSSEIVLPGNGENLNRDFIDAYGNLPVIPEPPTTDVLTYDIEELNRSIRLIDGRDNYFHVEVIDTETGEFLCEHKLELSHEYDGDIGDLTEVIFSKDKRRAVISEIKDPLYLSVPDIASAYILNVEDGSLTLISTERTWRNTWLDSSGKYLILINIGDRCSHDTQAVTSYMQVYSLEDGELTDSIAVSDEVDSTKEKNGFIGASYDDVEAIMKITRERLHWLNSEMERWNIYYRIQEDGLISCVEDELTYANMAKADVEENIEGLTPDPDYGSKLRFISKNNKEDGGYDIILHYYDDEYIASYNFNNKLISITLPDGTVIIPEEISIELNESSWAFKLGLGEKADNLKYDAYGAVPIHQIKNIGKIPIDIDIRYGEIKGCKAGSVPGKDTFVVTCKDKIIPPEGSVVIYTNVEPNESKGIPLVYYAPTELDIDASSMSAVFEIRAYAAKGN